MTEREKIEGEAIEHKITRIFEEAKKRNPEGFNLGTENGASTLKQYDSIETTSSQSLASQSRDNSRSPMLTGLKQPITTVLSPSAAPFQFNYFSEEEKSPYSNSVLAQSKCTKYRNPKSGQIITIFATTMNVPSDLQPM